MVKNTLKRKKGRFKVIPIYHKSLVKKWYVKEKIIFNINKNSDL